MNYDHKKIEKKWQKEWDASKIYSTPDSVQGKENYYTLVEFAYPSGNLHAGHWYAYGVTDIFARHKRMQGYNVLYPFGFDSFGLPAENAAIKNKKNPKEWTYKNIETMKVQLRSMGTMFDWSREIRTSDPEYYRWTQWMFNQFFKNDLAYRATTKVNWCENDQTILANEQVVNGMCERCGFPVVQRDQDQWMLRITKYADRLIDDLDKLDWPHSIKESQKNWIGRNEGSEIQFKIKNEELEITVFTTRADTLFGVTYVVLAPEHPLISHFTSHISNLSEVEAYIAATKGKLELDRQQSKEKTGVELQGIVAINPANGEEVPVWIADYVLASYGTGAVMAVPAHDERDFEFAKKYNLPMKQVVAPRIVDAAHPPREGKKNTERRIIHALVKHPTENTFISLHWKEFPWKTFITGGVEEGEDAVAAAQREIREETGYKNTKLVKRLPYLTYAEYYAEHKDVNRAVFADFLYFELEDLDKDEVADEEKKLHDAVWMDMDQMHTLSPVSELEHILFWMKNGDAPYTGDGILLHSNAFDGSFSDEARKKITEAVGGTFVKTYRLRDWGISRQRYWGVPIPIVYDPEGNAHPIPDEHLPWLLPEDVDHTPDGTAPLARSKELFARTEKIFGKGWRPEVETMDTFVDSSWYFYRYLDCKNENEFASREKMDAWMPIDLYMGGAEHTTMHLLYSRFWTKALYDLGLVKDDEAYKVRRNRGIILGPDGNKMSKSKGNVVDPDEVVERLGADTVRMYLAFMGPYGVTDNYPWDPNGVVGVRRFLERVWRLGVRIDEERSPVTDPDAERALHQMIKKMGESIESFKLNTAVSAMMICLNEMEKHESIMIDDLKKFLRVLAPFAPHMTEELWHEFGGEGSIHLSDWPQFDPEKLVSDTMTIVISINGKPRDQLIVPADMLQAEIESLARASEKIKTFLQGSEPKRTVYVPRKLLNFVV